jgi:hypothetical protein
VAEFASVPRVYALCLAALPGLFVDRQSGLASWTQTTRILVRFACSRTILLSNVDCSGNLSERLDFELLEDVNKILCSSASKQSKQPTPHRRTSASFSSSQAGPFN